MPKSPISFSIIAILKQTTKLRRLAKENFIASRNCLTGNAKLDNFISLLSWHSYNGRTDSSLFDMLFIITRQFGIPWIRKKVKFFSLLLFSEYHSEIKGFFSFEFPNLSNTSKGIFPSRLNDLLTLWNDFSQTANEQLQLYSKYLESRIRLDEVSSLCFEERYDSQIEQIDLSKLKMAEIEFLLEANLIVKEILSHCKPLYTANKIGNSTNEFNFVSKRDFEDSPLLSLAFLILEKAFFQYAERNVFLNEPYESIDPLDELLNAGLLKPNPDHANTSFSLNLKVVFCRGSERVTLMNLQPECKDSLLETFKRFPHFGEVSEEQPLKEIPGILLSTRDDRRVLVNIRILCNCKGNDHLMAPDKMSNEEFSIVFQ